MTSGIRVALFPDSYHEVNGVANTMRRFESYARQHERPMLVICGAEETRRISEGSVTRCEFRRGPLSFGLDKDLRFDLAFLRHYREILDALRAFGPDVVHVTGPSDVGIAGMTAAHELGIPVAASWHTNLHEYAGRRAASLVGGNAVLSNTVQDASFALTARYYRIARLLFAPNQELIQQLSSATGKPCFLMSRGVDTQTFAPMHRDRGDDGTVVIGYVGRLTTEKSVRDFAQFGRALQQAGVTNFRFVFVGQGSESGWLAANVPNAVMAGVHKGAELARQYANFDVFAFPSRTDTFGNVVLEALACGVPAVVTDAGGPKFIVQEGETGYVAGNAERFAAQLIALLRDAGLRRRMSLAAREAALRASWNAVFDAVYDAYASQLDFAKVSASRPSPEVALSRCE